MLLKIFRFDDKETKDQEESKFISPKIREVDKYIEVPFSQIIYDLALIFNRFLDDSI